MSFFTSFNVFSSFLLNSVFSFLLRIKFWMTGDDSKFAFKASRSSSFAYLKAISRATV